MIFAKFKESNGNFYAFIEAPVGFLNVEDAGRRIKQYITHRVVSVDGTMCLVLLSEKTHSYGRRNRVSKAEMTHMETKFNRLGYGKSTWLTLAEYKVRLASVDYDRGEV
jgi:hypothetical protein